MKESTPRKRFAIIDGKSVFYRGYYAMPDLSTNDGTPTGGVFGFSVMALEVIKRLKPDYVAVAWDKPKTNIRKRLALYPQYKAGRKPAPPDFYTQIPILHEVLVAFGWPLYELDDYEADDIMGTLAKQAQEKNIETLLITSDLDVLQLVGPLTKAYLLKKGLSNIELYSPESFEAKYTIKADQFLDLKALKGDSSDNIPGVPGIGEKTAIQLLKEYKTLDGVYQNLDLISNSVKKKLEDNKELAYLSKKIGAIWTDAPIKLKISEIDGSTCNPKLIQSIFQKLEFRTLARQLPEIMQVDISDDPTLATYQSAKNISNKVIDSDKKLDDFELPPTKELIIHSRSADSHGRRPLLLIISPKPGTVYTFDLSKLDAKALGAKLKSVLEDPKIGKVGYDLKYSIEVLLSIGIEMYPVAHDVLIAAFILNSLRREQTLTELAQSDLGYRGSSLDELSEKELQDRAGEVTDIINKLFKQQTDQLSKIPKLPELAEKIDWPVIPVLAHMEYAGIKLDVGYLNRFSEEVDDLISDLEQQIYGYANREFNIGSPQQLAEILFDVLELSKAGIKKGKNGFSTAARELDKLRGTHPIIDLITQYREVTKLKNTYIDSLPKLVDENSRVHTSFNLTIAQTGRLSSTDPNLQNIPVRTELGKRIRTAFIAGDGHKLVSADYSQFELRLAAVLAKDQDLIDLFNQDADIHTTTAAQIYNREPEDVTKQMRRAAKVVNFGVLYGMSSHGLSAATGMSYDQSSHFIENFFELRKPLLDYLNKLKERAKKDGYIADMFGRRRPMPDIHSSNFVVRSAAERAAINMPIQGTEADLMKLAMTDVYKKMSGEFPKAVMLLQIHDSILVECLSEDAGNVAALLKKSMEGIYKLPVKLTVDTYIGDNWGEL
ncbi:MAG TPA: DNA polymerase I [Candidatus Saccharimonadales bacterium]|nr:DNA polymerase I [Candidatus Saccharimonadales bacterium]